MEMATSSISETTLSEPSQVTFDFETPSTSKAVVPIKAPVPAPLLAPVTAPLLAPLPAPTPAPAKEKVPPKAPAPMQNLNWQAAIQALMPGQFQAPPMQPGAALPPGQLPAQALPLRMPMAPAPAPPPTGPTVSLKEKLARLLPPYNFKSNTRRTHRLMTYQVPKYRPSQHRLYCGCDTKHYTRIVAALQMILFGYLFVYGLSLRQAEIRKTVEVEENQNGTSIFSLFDFQKIPDEKEATDLVGKLSGDPYFQVPAGAIGLLLGISLFAGAQFGKPILLFLWLFVAAVTLLILASLLFLPAFWFWTAGWSPTLLHVICASVLPFGVIALCFNFVWTHFRELITDRQNQNPTPATKFYPVYLDVSRHILHT